MNVSLWLRLTRFRGLFFASSTTIVDGGAGDGGAGGDGGAEGDQGGGAGDDGSGTGGSGGDDESGDEGAGDDADLDSTKSDDEDLDPDDEGEGDERSQREKRAAANKEKEAINAALNKMRESDPEGAKVLRKAFYTQEQSLNAYRGAFATPAAAREAFDMIESYGGEDGIQSLKQDAGDFAIELTKIKNGDTSIIDAMVKDFPDSIPKLAPYINQKFKESHPVEFDRMAARTIYDTLDQKKIIAGLERAMEIIADGKQRDGYLKMQEIRNWIAELERFAATKPTTSPADRQISEREAAVAKQEKASYHREVSKVVVTRLNTAIEKSIAPYIRDAIKAKRGLTSEQRKSLVGGINGRLTRSFEADTRYQERFAALLAEGDVRKIDRFVASQVDLKVKKATRSEWQSRGFAGGIPSKKAAAAAGAGKGAGSSGAAAGAGGQGGGPQGAVYFSKKPTPDQIDWSKDRNRLRFTSHFVNGKNIGEATLKDGKKVWWNWDLQ